MYTLDHKYLFSIEINHGKNNKTNGKKLVKIVLIRSNSRQLFIHLFQTRLLSNTFSILLSKKMNLKRYHRG